MCKFNPFICFDAVPPDSVAARGSLLRGKHGKILEAQHNKLDFAAGLDVMCVEQPCCCLLSTLGVPCGFTSCYSRHLVLKSYANGVSDFICCQGYVDKCCCFEPASCFPGSSLGLCLEGCCCPMFSLSIARIHVMDIKRLRPDPMDYQTIACSNCLQLLSCICDCLSICVEDLREAALVIDLVADLVTCSVGGCMGAQIYHEVHNDPGIKAPGALGMERDSLTASSSAKYGTTPGATPVTIGVPVSVA